MNLAKLFETQRLLDERIVREKSLEGRDTLQKKILALLVELGELANEERSWKFWSNDQEPRRIKKSIAFANPGGPFEHVTYPLLEEYVDCLHFILSIGLDYKIDIVLLTTQTSDINKWGTIEKQFNSIFYLVSNLNYISEKEVADKYYINLFFNFIALGQMLGFAWEQIEIAYFEKNKINHTRQDTGY